MTFFSNFDDIPPPFSELLSKVGSDSLFFSRDWFDIYIDTVVQNKNRISIFTKSTDSSIKSCVMLPLQDEVRQNMLSPRTLSSLANFYSSRFEPLWLSGEQFPSASLRGLVSELTTSDPKWDIVRISPCQSNSIVVDELKEALSENSWAVQEYFCFTNLYLDNTYDSFASYLSTRGSKIRKTAANRTRKFDRDSSNTFEIVSSNENLDTAMNLFSDLYKKRWKKSEPFPKFLPNLAKRCAERGWLRLGIATIDGRPAAVQFWILKDEIAYIFKVAYDEEFSNMSVGSVALFKMFQHIIDNEKVREIDFLTGDDAYKCAWMSDSRNMVGLAAFNKRTIRGLGAACINIGGSALKKRVASWNKSSTGIS